MTPTDLRAYMSARGLSKRGAAADLDISLNRLQRMLAGGRIPRHIGLAIAAVMAGLGEWSGGANTDFTEPPEGGFHGDGDG